MIEVRLGQAQDAAFIYATWLRSYRHSSEFAKKIQNDIYYQWHHKVIDRIANRGGNFYVAYATGEPDVILGFLCVEGPNLVHYCYVKKVFRKMGVARTLLKAALVEEAFTFTHWTSDTNRMIQRYPNLTYNPYLI